MKYFNKKLPQLKIIVRHVDPILVQIKQINILLKLVY